MFLFGFILGCGLGGWIGLYLGGWRAILRVSKIAHDDLMGRAGLRRR